MVSMDAIYVRILETLHHAGKPLHRYWPWKPSPTPRTHQSLIINAKDATIDGVTVSAEVIYSLSSSEQANTGTCLDYLTYITLD